jgi:hypothetical protein
MTVMTKRITGRSTIRQFWETNLAATLIMLEARLSLFRTQQTAIRISRAKAKQQQAAIMVFEEGEEEVEAAVEGTAIR